MCSPIAALLTNWLLLGALAVLVVVAIAFVIVARLRATKDASRGNDQISLDAYIVQTSILTPAERSFFGVLQSVIPEGAAIASKVRLADVFAVRPGCDRRTWQRAFNRIAAKHVDFLVIRKDDGRPSLGIELDDASHNRDDRKERDEFVDSVFASTGLPLLRISARAAYDPRELDRKIAGMLNSAAR